MNDVVRYSEWTDSALKLSPSDEAFMEKRHAAPSSTGSDSAPKAGASEDHLKAQIDSCADRISEKWTFYNQTFKFKPEVSLTKIIETFAMPAQEFVNTTYPALYAGGPKIFWMVMFLGLVRSGVPSKAALDQALKELDAKFRKGS